jgi:hypothetical protein
VDGNGKTGNREHVPSTASTSVTVETAENWAKTGNREHVPGDPGTKSDGTSPVNGQHVRYGENGLKLGENVDGNAKTVNRDKVRRNVSLHVRYG